MPPRKKDWRERSVDYLQKLGKPRAKAFYRCGVNTGSCRTRRILPRELWEYMRPPKCPTCGRRDDWRLDMNRTRDYKNKTGDYARCFCDGKDYPHKPGSIKICVDYDITIPDFDAPGLSGPDDEVPF